MTGIAVLEGDGAAKANEGITLQCRQGLAEISIQPIPICQNVGCGFGIIYLLNKTYELLFGNFGSGDYSNIGRITHFGIDSFSGRYR
ncbi:MAG: hypothetical protein U0670_07875, partial [Anaerolineae bacterium]